MKNLNTYIASTILILFVLILLVVIYKPDIKNNQSGSDLSDYESEMLKTMHPTWDMDNNGLNDCEQEGICDHTIDYSSPRKSSDYNQASYKKYISESCQSFFDGCNNCQRTSDSNEIACTRKFCEAYDQPKCLDEAM